MEQFNFFGAKGRLKNVEEVVSTKAKELFDKQKADEKNEAEKKKYENAILIMKNEKQEADQAHATEIEEKEDLATKVKHANDAAKKGFGYFDKAIALADKLQNRNSELTKEVSNLVLSRKRLLRQLYHSRRSLKIDELSSETREMSCDDQDDVEAQDVGQTAPELVSSKE